jgi:hypothetical protein
MVPAMYPMYAKEWYGMKLTFPLAVAGALGVTLLLTVLLKRRSPYARVTDDSDLYR